MKMRKKLVPIIGIVFMLCMVGFTIASRAVYQNALPIVQPGLPFADTFIYDFTEYAVARATDESGKFEISLQISKDRIAGDFPFYRGDTIELTFPNMQSAIPQQGLILSLTHGEDAIELVISFSGLGVQDGDSVVALLSKKSKEYSPCLPLSAVYYDGDKLPYVYFIDEKAGPWGKEYTVIKSYVNILLQDDQKVAVTGAFDKPVVLSSAIPLQDGQSVRFYP